jgi:hypothetical protein
VSLRTSCRNQVHGVLGKLGVPVTCSDIFGTAGSAWLDQLHLLRSAAPSSGRASFCPAMRHHPPGLRLRTTSDPQTAGRIE